jgi:hypothetical protein
LAENALILPLSSSPTGGIATAHEVHKGMNFGYQSGSSHHESELRLFRAMKTKLHMTRTTPPTPSHRLGANRCEIAKRTRRRDPIFSQSRDIWEDQCERQIKADTDETWYIPLTMNAEEGRNIPMDETSLASLAAAAGDSEAPPGPVKDARILQTHSLAQYLDCCRTLSHSTHPVKAVYTGYAMMPRDPRGNCH